MNSNFGEVKSYRLNNGTHLLGVKAEHLYEMVCSNITYKHWFDMMVQYLKLTPGYDYHVLDGTILTLPTCLRIVDLSGAPLRHLYIYLAQRWALRLEGASFRTALKHHTVDDYIKTYKVGRTLLPKADHIHWLSKVAPITSKGVMPEDNTYPEPFLEKWFLTERGVL